MILNNDLPEYLLECLLNKSNADLPSKALDNFSLEDAYRVSNEIYRLRQNKGEKAIGVKIGFTNQTIWKQYNVNAPMFGRMYASTVLGENENFNLERFLEPKLEPEIFFRLRDIPNSSMDDYELLSCCSHFGIGVELVQSVFKDWKFTLVDTVSAFGLHGQYKILREVELPSNKEIKRGIVDDLKSFTITLKRDEQTLETGKAENILGVGPLKALRAYVDFCAKREEWFQLDSIITTGTITDAFDMEEGLRFSIDIDKFGLGPFILNL